MAMLACRQQQSTDVLNRPITCSWPFLHDNQVWGILCMKCSVPDKGCGSRALHMLKGLGDIPCWPGVVLKKIHVPHGPYLAQDGSIGLEALHRIKAAVSFHRLQSLWLDRHVKDEVKLRVYQTIVQATLLYACETWAISLDTVSSVEVFQMQCLRRIFRDIKEGACAECSDSG